MNAPPSFVGRYAELVAVHDILRQERRYGTVVVASGPRGIGKTSFLTSVARLAEQHPAIGIHLCGSELREVNVRDTALFRQSGEQWIVCTIDDLHLAEPGDLYIFSRLCELTARSRMLLLATYLEDTSTPEEAAACIARALDEGALALRLTAVERPDAQAIFEALCIKHDLCFNAETQSAILDMAGGNPGLLHEFVREFASGTLDKHFIPASVHARLSRLRLQLSADSFHLLQIAAVIGQRFRSDWLVELSGLSVDHVATALQSACDLHIVSEDPQNGEWLFFTQSVMHQAIYYSIITLQRNRLHACVAKHLSASDAKACCEALQFERLLGSQFVAAGENRRALPHLIRAADEAYTQCKYNLAARLYSTVLDFIDETVPEWAHLQERVIFSYQAENSWEPSIRHLQALRSFFANKRDFGRHLWTLARLIEAYDNLDDFLSAQRTFTEFHSAARLQGPGCAAEGYVTWAMALWFSGRRADARKLIGNMMDMPGEPQADIRYMLVRALLYSWDQPIETTFSLVDEASRLAALTNTSLAEPFFYASEIAWELGCSQRALDYNERGRIAIPNMTRSTSQMAAIISMKIALDLGQLQTCREHALHVASGSSVWDAPIAALVTLVGVRMGEKALVDDFFRPALMRQAVTSKSYQWTSLIVRGFAETMVARGMREELSSLLHDALRHKEAVDPRFSIPLNVAQYGRRSDFPLARTKIAAFTRGPGGRVAKASLALFDTIVAARNHRGDQAQRAARRAVSLFEGLNWPLMVAKALETGGRPLEALERYRACFAWGDVDRLCATADPKIGLGSPLTRRENEVKDLLERGMANRQIATTLCISERTTAHHVEAVLRKLGLRSRWQLAQSSTVAAELLQSRHSNRSSVVE